MKMSPARAKNSIQFLTLVSPADIILSVSYNNDARRAKDLTWLIIVKVAAIVKRNKLKGWFYGTEILIFEHEKFGKVRVIMVNGKPWFVAVDVCKVLEIKNSRDAVSKLYEDEKQTVLIPARGVSSTDTQGGYQNMTVVNEPGLYKLVFSSRKKEAFLSGCAGIVKRSQLKGW